MDLQLELEKLREKMRLMQIDLADWQFCCGWLHRVLVEEDAGPNEMREALYEYQRLKELRPRYVGAR